MKIDETGELDGRIWIKYKIPIDNLRPYLCCVSKDDYNKYQLGGTEMLGNDTYIVEFSDDEFQNWKRTKMIDQMLI